MSVFFLRSVVRRFLFHLFSRLRVVLWLSPHPVPAQLYNGPATAHKPSRFALPTGQSVRFRVRAANAIGPGPCSPPSAPFVPLPPLPPPSPSPSHDFTFPTLGAPSSAASSRAGSPVPSFASSSAARPLPFSRIANGRLTPSRGVSPMGSRYGSSPYGSSPLNGYGAHSASHLAPDSPRSPGTFMAGGAASGADLAAAGAAGAPVDATARKRLQRRQQLTRVSPQCICRGCNPHTCSVPHLSMPLWASPCYGPASVCQARTALWRWQSVCAHGTHRCNSQALRKDWKALLLATVLAFLAFVINSGGK
jgi:hypothetical protein